MECENDEKLLDHQLEELVRLAVNVDTFDFPHERQFTPVKQNEIADLKSKLNLTQHKVTNSQIGKFFNYFISDATDLGGSVEKNKKNTPVIC